MHTIAILGSTGSIGTQALEVISHFPQLFTVAALTAQSNDRLLEEQINIFRPKVAVLTDEAAAKRLCQRYKGPTRILMGEDGLLAAATETDAQTVLTSLVGFA
ncbi:MAG: 1-deoxy-D-xylulose-5-phosphate reductoisomerase, partial [Sporomusaceae bacterium]|nr:1-deoxy-D-xylulose-5-phosphate reductoisomerase [Sporomusaceae bacterium]